MIKLELKQKYIIIESTDDSLTGYIVTGIIKLGQEISLKKENNEKIFEIDIIEVNGNNEYTLINSNNSIIIKPYEN